MELNDIMEMDHVIRVLPDGSVDGNVSGVYAPELKMETLDDDAHSVLAEHEAAYVAEAKRQGWELLAGFTGQYGYRGVMMHPSEYAGGGLEEYILSRPGLWVAITVETDDDDENAAGWAVAYRPFPEN